MRLSFRKKYNTSEKIKEATLNILARDGYEDISMRKIAKEADVALGQLTYYYKTKNNLIVAVVDEVLDMFYDGLKERVSSSEKKIEEIVNSIENVINEDSQVDQLLITVISMAQVNKRLNAPACATGTFQDVDKINRLEAVEKACKARRQACKKGSLPRCK